MMTTRELQDEIIRLKKENDICILAHAYQSHEILEVADFTGDSYGLSKQAATAPQKNVLMCGVRFMAETCKILSPDKHVFLSNSAAGCPMAEQLDVELLQSLKDKNPDYTVVADFTGDSYGLSKQAATAPQKNVLMCGVRFMAETCKILSPDKHVFLSNSAAGCPMAEQLDVELLQSLKDKNPDYTVVAYINTTSELKTICDVCVTSSSAVKIVKNIDNNKILFIPDCNLGAWVEEQVPEKAFKFVHGGCPTHLRMSIADVERAKAAHPAAKLLVHPECLAEVSKAADYIGSTTGIIDYAKSSTDKEFIIGTENSILQHLQYECPDKSFYPLSKDCVCHNMKLTTLMDVYNCVKGAGGEEIILPDDIRTKAKACIDTMLTLGE